jgi:hypothetical protein
MPSILRVAAVLALLCLALATVSAAPMRRLQANNEAKPAHAFETLDFGEGQSRVDEQDSGRFLRFIG